MTIEVRVESRTSGGLRLVGSLPAQRPCRLEGKNGIGKSAMIRLLVLISGRQPYEHQTGSWQSLKKLVGPTEIVIAGLTGPHATARIRLTPERWPDDPDGPVGDWIGELQLDGAVAPASALFDHFDVVHLVGTERLGHTLELQYSRLGTALQVTQARLRELDEQRAELGEVADDLKLASPRRAEQEYAELIAAQAERQQCAHEVEGLGPRVADLLQAAAFRALLDTGDAVEQEQRLKELRGQLETARAALSSSETKHETAVAALNKGSKAQREAARTERQFRRISQQLDELAFRQATLGPRLEQAGIESDLDRLDEVHADKLRKAMEKAIESQRLAQLKAARLSRSEIENNLIDEMRIVLGSAIEHGLSGLVIATLSGTDITVADLRDALGQVRDLDEVDLEELRIANAAVSEFSELTDVFVQRAALLDQASAARASLEGLEQAISVHDDLREQAKQARIKLDEASARVRLLNMQIGAVTRSGLGGADVADAEARVTELLGRHGVEAENLTASLIEAQANLDSLRQRKGSLQSIEARLNDQAARRRVLREQLRTRALRIPQHRWLARLATALSAAHATPGVHEEAFAAEADWPDTVWQALADHVAGVRVAISNLVREVGGLEAVARSRGTTGPYRPALRSVIEHDALEQLSAPPIAEALFDGGDVQRVNLDESTVTWKTRHGEVRTRPLDAFSSGEQALGFMRARLEQVAAMPAQNRLIFLDEFGAFIAADRRRPLAELLTNDELLGLADQVVVVLPLQADYEAELDQTTGPLHDIYALRAAGVAVAGYFTEVFDR